LNIYDREGMSCGSFCNDSTSGAVVSDKYVLVGRPAIDCSATNNREAEARGIGVFDISSAWQNADNVPIEITRLKSPT
jgi:hypothetical protein